MTTPTMQKHSYKRARVTYDAILLALSLHGETCPGVKVKRCKDALFHLKKRKGAPR